MRKHLPQNLPHHFFFDRTLGGEADFTQIAIEAASGEGLRFADFVVLDAQSGAILTEKAEGQDPTAVIEFMQAAVQGIEVLGVSIVGRKRNWYLHQENPVSLGIVGSTRSDANSRTDDFVSCENIKGWDTQRIKYFDLFYGEGAYRSVISLYCSC
jgi:hypothetical protein